MEALACGVSGMFVVSSRKMSHSDTDPLLNGKLARQLVSGFGRHVMSAARFSFAFAAGALAPVTTTRCD